MSIACRWEVVCDRCQRAVPDPDKCEQEGDVLLPDGWVHTMMGEDLCGWCYIEAHR